MLAKVTADAANSKECALARQGIVPRHLLSGSGIVRHQHAQRPWTILAGQPHAESWVLNAPGEDQVDGGHEVVRIFQEERALLGKENLKALIHRDLRLIGLDLTEIRVDGRIQNELIFQDGLGVQTGLPEGGALSISRITRVPQVQFLV